MIKRGIDKEVVVLLITTLLTALTWTGMEIYRAYKKTAMPEGVERQLKPLSPKLNTKAFDQLENLNP